MQLFEHVKANFPAVVTLDLSRFFEVQLVSSSLIEPNDDAIVGVRVPVHPVSLNSPDVMRPRLPNPGPPARLLSL